MLTPLQTLKNEQLEILAILRFFDQERNRRNYDRLEASVRAEIDKLILEKNFSMIKIKMNDELNLSQRTLGYLRTVAQSLGIYRYSLLSRRELVDQIVNYQNGKANKQTEQDSDQDSSDRVCIRP